MKTVVRLHSAYAEIRVGGVWERIEVPWNTVETAAEVARRQAAKRNADASRVMRYWLVADDEPIEVWLRDAGAVRCATCGNYLPGHASGAVDICTCDQRPSV